MIDLRIRSPDLARLRRLDNRRVEFAEAQALNRTATNVRRYGLRQIADEMGVKISQLRKRGRSRPSRRERSKFGSVAKGRRATRRRLETAVIGSGRPFNVSRWTTQPIKVGNRVVAVRHDAYGRAQTAEGTWLLNNGAVVVRSGNSFRGVFGPGVGQMMERRNVVLGMQREAARRFPGHLASALRFVFSSRAPAFLR